MSQERIKLCMGSRIEESVLLTAPVPPRTLILEDLHPGSSAVFVRCDRPGEPCPRFSLVCFLPNGRSES